MHLESAWMKKARLIASYLQYHNIQIAKLSFDFFFFGTSDFALFAVSAAHLVFK